MGKTWKDKPRKYGRSQVPPPGHIHEDKRKKTRSQEKIDLKVERRQVTPGSLLNESDF